MSLTHNIALWLIQAVQERQKHVNILFTVERFPLAKMSLMLPASPIRSGGAFAARAGFGHGGAWCRYLFFVRCRVRFCFSIFRNICGRRHLGVGTTNVAECIATLQGLAERDGNLTGMQVLARPLVIFHTRSRDENRLCAGTCANGQEQEPKRDVDKMLSGYLYNGVMHMHSDKTYTF